MDHTSTSLVFLWSEEKGLELWWLTPIFQQYFSYILAVSFIGEGNFYSYEVRLQCITLHVTFIPMKFDYNGSYLNVTFIHMKLDYSGSYFNVTFIHMKLDYNGSYFNVTFIPTRVDYNGSYLNVTFIPMKFDYNASYFNVTCIPMKWRKGVRALMVYINISVVKVSFIGERNRSIRIKPLACRKWLTNFLT